MMKIIRQIILLVLTLFTAGIVAPVYADEPASSWTGEIERQHRDPVAKAEKHLAKFKDELKITNDQEQAWRVYVEKTKSNIQDIRDRLREAQHDKPQTAPERFDRHVELLRARLASFENMDEALKHLYAELTPEQKAIADRHFAKMRH